MRPIAIVVLAACLSSCLAGCGVYSMFDPDASSSFLATSKQASWQNNARPGAADPQSTASTSAPPAADQADSAAMASLFARASVDKPGNDMAPPPVPAAIPAADAAPKPVAPNPVAPNPVAPNPVAAKPAPKPVVMADAGPPLLPVEPPAAAADKLTAEPQGRAYLFRGVAGLIYSRGIDKLEERIKRTGISTSIDTYLMWRPVADQAIRDYRRDPQPIILIGHSMGGDSVVAFAETLNAENIPVSLLVTYDPTRIADNVPPNVERYINIYQSSNFMGGGNVVQGARFHGHYASYNLKDHSELVHINIEKADRLQEQLVAKVTQLVATPANAEGEAVPIHLEVPAEAGIELWDSGLPVAAHAGDTLKTLAATYHVPLWSLTQINSVSDRTVLSEGQRIVIPRHLVPMASPSTVTSYAPTAR